MMKEKELLETIKELAYNSPELNMANYCEDEVRDLNDAMIDICRELYNYFECDAGNGNK